jgi:hypothetical protein
MKILNVFDLNNNILYPEILENISPIFSKNIRNANIIFCVHNGILDDYSIRIENNYFSKINKRMYVYSYPSEIIKDDEFTELLFSKNI